MQQIGLCPTSLSRGRAKPNSQVVPRRAASLTVKAGASYDAGPTLIYQSSTIWYSGLRPHERSIGMSVLDERLSDFDPEIAELIGKELERQRSGLEMIAAENHAPLAVMQAQGSALTHKYAEGYPGRRYSGVCGHVDDLEQPAI